MSVNYELCYKKRQGESVDVHKDTVNEMGKSVLATPKCVVNKMKNTGSRIVLGVARLFNVWCKHIQAGYTDTGGLSGQVYLCRKCKNLEPSFITN